MENHTPQFEDAKIERVTGYKNRDELLKAYMKLKAAAPPDPVANIAKDLLVREGSMRAIQYLQVNKDLTWSDARELVQGWPEWHRRKDAR